MRGEMGQIRETGEESTAPLCVHLCTPLMTSLLQGRLAMASIAAAEGVSQRCTSAVWSDPNQQLLGGDCSTLLQKVGGGGCATSNAY